MIQHRAAHFVLNKPWQRNTQDSITHMLEILKWPSLQKCREDSRLILLFKLANSLLFIHRNYMPLPSLLSTTREQHNLKYMHMQPSSGIYRIAQNFDGGKV